LRRDVSEQLLGTVDCSIAVSIQSQPTVRGALRCPSNLNGFSVPEEVKQDTIRGRGQMEARAVGIDDNWTRITLCVYAFASIIIKIIQRTATRGHASIGSAASQGRRAGLRRGRRWSWGLKGNCCTLITGSRSSHIICSVIHRWCWVYHGTGAWRTTWAVGESEGVPDLVDHDFL